MGIPIGQRIWRKWDTFSVSTYLFVRCNNHKCVQHLCEEVPKTWLLLDDSVWVWVLFEPLARGSFWYKCPLCTWDSKNFHPTPPHLTSFITYCFHTYLHHTYHTFANILLRATAHAADPKDKTWWPEVVTCMTLSTPYEKCMSPSRPYGKSKWHGVWKHTFQHSFAFSKPWGRPFAFILGKEERCSRVE